MNKLEAQRAGERMLVRVKKKATNNCKLRLLKYGDNYKPVIMLFGGTGRLYHSQMSGMYVAVIYKNGLRVLAEEGVTPECAVSKLIRSCRSLMKMYVKLDEQFWSSQYRRVRL